MRVYWSVRGVCSVVVCLHVCNGSVIGSVCDAITLSQPLQI